MFHVHCIKVAMNTKAAANYSKDHKIHLRQLVFTGLQTVESHDGSRYVLRFMSVGYENGGLDY